MPVRPRRPAALPRYPDREGFSPRLHEPASGEQPGPPPNGVDPHLAGILSPRSFEADQYRVLGHFLEGVRTSGTTGPKAVGITSPVAGDGKTTTAINLAVTLAQSSGTRVLLVDADLRRPNVAARMGLSLDGPGLAAAALDERADLGMVVRKAHGVAVLAAGAAAASPYVALESERVARLLAQARDSYDYIVLDTPPVLLVPDWKAISQWVDGFLVVVAAHRTPRKVLGETLNAMEPSKVLGVVFNGDARSLSGYYKRYGGRYYDERPGLWDRWRSWLGRR
jgi:capsular exopolysaccharide synthesis family protein